MANKELLYEVTYVRQNGELPVGAKVQFTSNTYRLMELYFSPGKLMVQNFKKEIIEAFKRIYGKDIESDVAVAYGSNHFFDLRCISLEEYKKSIEKPKDSKTNAPKQVSHSPNSKNKKSCSGCLLKLILLLIGLFIALVIFGYVVTKCGN